MAAPMRSAKGVAAAVGAGGAVADAGAAADAEAAEAAVLASGARRFAPMITMPGAVPLAMALRASFSEPLDCACEAACGAIAPAAARISKVVFMVEGR